MRYQPNHLDSDLSARLTEDVSRALTGSGDSDGRRFVQLSYIYDRVSSGWCSRSVGPGDGEVFGGYLVLGAGSP